MKFIRNSRDDHELLFATLDDICTEKRKLYQLRYKRLPTEVTVTISEFENKAKALNIQDVQSFFQSEQFENNRYVLNSTQGMIVKHFS
jgi:DNA replication licensing factor MCM2